MGIYCASQRRVTDDNWKKRAFLLISTQSVQTGTERKWGVVGNGPLYQSVNKSLRIEKSGERKETDFTSLVPSVKKCGYANTAKQ